MKLIYRGSMSECFLGGTIRMVRGETYEVDDKLAKSLLKDQPENFSEPKPSRMPGGGRR